MSTLEPLPESAVIRVRLDGIVEEWNAGAEALYGYTAAEMIGRNISLLEAPGHSAEIAGILACTALGETILQYQTERLRKDGARIAVTATLSPARDAAGHVTGAIAIVRGWADGAQLENALRFSEERYRSLALASAQIVWTKNTSGEMTADSLLWCAFTGQSPEEIAGRGFLLAIHPDDRARIAAVFAEAQQNRSVYRTEYRLRRRDGEYRHMSVRGVPVLDGDGYIREWVGSCADITEHKRAEEAARRSQREMALKTAFATIFLTLPEHEIFASVLDAILTHTGSAQGIFGYLDEDGALVFPMWNWDERPVAGEALRLEPAQWTGLWGHAVRERRSLYSNQPFPGDPPALRRVLAAPIIFQKEPIGVFAIANKPSDYGEDDRHTLERIARDIAPIFKGRLDRDSQERARRRAEGEVRRINAELEQRVEERTQQLQAANRELEAFAYSVSHDLRAPLRAIHGFSRILIEEYAPALPPDCRHYIQVIRDNALQMGELIDDLLNFSRLSRQPLDKQAVYPAELVSQVLGDLRPEIDGRFEITVGDLPRCAGDPVLLKQVFVNLLSNAIKYSGRRANPKIEIGVLAPPNAHAAVYYVRDNGVGFDMRYVHKLFGVFQRLHHAAEYPGTGIGLAIVQRILHRHGGRIWAEAELDKGATFYFTLEPEP